MLKDKGIFLKILLSRSPEAFPPTILKQLPNEIRETLLSNLIESKDIAPLLNQKSKTLEKWHYSWISQFLAPLDLKKRQAFMPLLNLTQQKGVASVLHTTPVLVEPTLFQKNFYKFCLYPLLKWDTVLPIEYLPKSSFNRLLELKKNELLKLIDYLGFYDLAHEMRRIVAKKTLKDIYACLSKEEQIFLRQCLHAKDNVVTPNLHLENWKGDKKILMALLHRRGLTRLSLALSGQHPDLIWHLAHILDTGRGQLLQKNTHRLKITSLTDAVGLQVENALNNLSKRIPNE